MDRPKSRQQHIQLEREEVARRFPALWQTIIAEWRQPGAEDRAWLMYSANYLFRTQNERWAIDPVRLEYRLAGAPSVDHSTDLAELSFVLLTHEHKDHLDIELIRSLRHLPVTWIVPEAMLSQVRNHAGLRDQQVVIPKPLQPIEIKGIRITPFDGMHWEKPARGDPGQPRGVPATGYLVEFAGKRWLFPGDTRTYDASYLPALGNVDGLCAHVWLGRNHAADARPPELEAFCRFCLDLHPGQVVLTHLQEFGRAAEDHWDKEHARLLLQKMGELCADLPIVPALMGGSFSL